MRTLLSILNLFYLLVLGGCFRLLRSLWPRLAGYFEPRFRKEGTLRFSSDTKLLQQIDMEVAKGKKEIQRGLMFRQSMQGDQGMLFLMPQEKPQSFWMLNTYISLDIIFVNSDMEIVAIQANAQPHSTKRLPSLKPARYVVEVVAGFCAGHGIREGDKIQFDLR